MTSENSDHDILVTLVSEVRQVRTDIKELKDDNTDKLKDYEARIRSLESYRWKLVGIFSAISTALTLAIDYFSKK